MREGMTLFSQEDYSGAAKRFARAVSRDWKHHQARLFLARALALAGQVESCSQEITKLTELASSDAGVLQEAGETLARFGLFDQARKVYERSFGIKRDGRVLAHLADMAERLSDLEQAFQYAEDAIALDPDEHLARLVLARVCRRQKNLEQARGVIAQALDRRGASDTIRSKQFYEQATILDGLGLYAQAVESLHQAKACLQSKARMLRQPAEQAQYTLRRLVQSFTQPRVDAWISASKGLEPARVAALVGFPRSGTTLLEQVLDAHPEIESVEETVHLSSELVTGFQRAVPDADSIEQALDRVSIEAVRSCRKRYIDALRGHVRGQVVDQYLLDKNPIRTLVMPVLRRAIPDARIIVALRDPRDVVLSNLMQAFEPTAMNLPFLDVEQAGAFYTLNMDGWLKLRDLIGGWVEVRYEDVVQDETTQARRVLELLNLEWNDSLSRYREHLADKAVRSPTYAAVREQTHSRAVHRWEHYADYLKPCLPELERVARVLGYEV